MALTANTASVEILEDSAQKVVAKLLYFQSEPGDESDVLKINVATLSHRTVILTTNAFDPGQRGFEWPGRVRGQTSNAVGHILAWHPSTASANGTLVVVVESGTFAEEVVESEIGGFTANVIAITTPPHTLAIESVVYSVSPGAVVALQFANSTTHVPVLTVSGSGYIGRNHFGTRIVNNVPETDGHLYVSTAGVSNNAGYSLILELRKDRGFAEAPVH